nr:hypothetical protein [Deltaproteobacteria bacterium]
MSTDGACCRSCGAHARTTESASPAPSAASRSCLRARARGAEAVMRLSASVWISTTRSVHIQKRQRPAAARWKLAS